MGPAADEVVKCCAHSVQSAVAVHGIHTWRHVGVAGGEAHLSWRKKLRRAHLTHANRVALGPHQGVARPRQMNTPHLTGTEPEALGPGSQHQRGVMSGASAPSLSAPHAHVQVLSLGDVLSAPTPGQIEDLQRPRRNGQSDRQLSQQVVLTSLAVQRLFNLEHAARVQGQAGLQPETGLLVSCVDEYPPATALLVHIALDATSGEQR